MLNLMLNDSCYAYFIHFYIDDRKFYINLKEFKFFNHLVAYILNLAHLK